MTHILPVEWIFASADNVIETHEHKGEFREW